MVKKRKISLKRIMDAVERGDYTGFCVACGSEQEGCEPDARNCECENCGKHSVFGAEELLISNVG
jgi:hypothetical protein